jgi:hypothetical protein
MRCRSTHIAVGTVLIVAVATAIAAETPRFSPTQSRYLEGCGGCHGIQGVSSEKDVPQLRDVVGRFLCTTAGREYLIRLPNVAFANADDRLLASLMNYVVFDLGGASAPEGAAPYSAAEVAALRRQPLKNQPLAQMRAKILTDAINACGRRAHTGAKNSVLVGVAG